MKALYIATSVMAKVVSFDSDQFSESDEGWFVKFYGTWCQHSQLMFDEWQLFDETPEINVGAVDCDLSWDVCDKFNVDELPTLLWFPPKSRKWVKYNGERSVDSLYEFSVLQGHKRIVDL